MLRTQRRGGIQEELLHVRRYSAEVRTVGVVHKEIFDLVDLGISTLLLLGGAAAHELVLDGLRLLIVASCGHQRRVVVH